MDTATKTRIDAAKIRRKATGDLIGNKITSFYDISISGGGQAIIHMNE